MIGQSTDQKLFDYTISDLTHVDTGGRATCGSVTSSWEQIRSDESSRTPITSSTVFTTSWSSNWSFSKTLSSISDTDQVGDYTIYHTVQLASYSTVQHTFDYSFNIRVVLCELTLDTGYCPTTLKYRYFNSRLV